MKPHEEWLYIARSNYNYAIAKFDENVRYEERCNQAQQSVEKAFFLDTTSPTNFSRQCRENYNLCLNS